MTLPQPSGPSQVDLDDSSRRELKRLAEIYATRARELSEAVATLGGHITAGRPFQETINEIRRLRVLMEKACEDLITRIHPSPAQSWPSSNVCTGNQPDDSPTE